LTHEASHNDNGFTDVKASSRVRREDDVSKVIEGVEFRRLLAA